MSYRLEDLYHFAVTDEVSEEEARFAAEKAVREHMEEWFATHPNDYSLQSIFTAGCCAGRTIRSTINKHLKNGKVTV
jgi:hypothetical protein